MVWTNTRFVRLAAGALAVSAVVVAQPALRLKVGAVREAHLGAGHQVIQFDEPPSAETIAALNARGVRVLADVPDNALLVSTQAGDAELRDLGVRFAARFEAGEKVSSLVASRALGVRERDTLVSEYLVVEFHSDVDPGQAAALVLQAAVGIEIYQHPDLAPNHILLHATERGRAARAVRTLAERDEVAYIFPASEELIRGSYVVACAGAVTTNGSAGQLIATYGDGWDGPGQNATTLQYFFGQMTAKLPVEQARAEILRAAAEWSRVINLTWQAGSSASAVRTVNFLFGAGSHGDNYPFDGPGRVLGHTFYPANPNPEPIAGDVHLDDDEAWRVGANIDLFSVTLHELGHALGLGHSDDPTAVMYPYYRMASTLAAADKAAILSLYAAAGGGSTAPEPPAPSPLTLTVNVPTATTTATTVALSGTVTGGTVAPNVTWSSLTGAAGVAQVSGQNWTIPSVALAVGVNNITVAATSGSTQVWRVVSVTREQPASQNPVDRTAPLLVLTSPAATAVITTGSSINIRGLASDNVGVTRVTWVTNTSGSGVAAGTASWSATVPLIRGSNTVVVRAFDAAGNYSWRTVIVTRR